MASEKITAMIEEVKTLTVLELAELVHALEEEFGVSAAAQVAVVAGAADAAQFAGSAGLPDLRQAAHERRRRADDAGFPQRAAFGLRLCSARDAAPGGAGGAPCPQAVPPRLRQVGFRSPQAKAPPAGGWSPRPSPRAPLSSFLFRSRRTCAAGQRLRPSKTVPAVQPP